GARQSWSTAVAAGGGGDHEPRTYRHRPPRIRLAPAPDGHAGGHRRAPPSRGGGPRRPSPADRRKPGGVVMVMEFEPVERLAETPAEALARALDRARQIMSTARGRRDAAAEERSAFADAYDLDD